VLSSIAAALAAALATALATAALAPPLTTAQTSQSAIAASLRYLVRVASGPVGAKMRRTTCLLYLFEVL